MDFLQALIEMLRGKPGGPPQSDEAPEAMSKGVESLSDPRYAAYVREAKSMGETPVSPAEYKRTQGY